MLKDIVGDEVAGAGKVEFAVMVMGGAASLKSKEEEVEPELVAGIGGGKEVLGTEEFWSDLRGFLVQRLKDEKEGERVWAVFKDSVKGDK